MGVQVIVDGVPVTLDTRLWSWDATINPVAPNSYIGSAWCDPVEVFRTQRSVRTVVGFLSRNIAQVSLHAFDLADDGDRERVPAARTVSKLLTAPSPTTTAFEFMRQLVVDLCLWDRYVSLIDRVDGRIQLRRIPPDRWWFDRRVDDSPKSIKVFDLEKRTTIDVQLTDALWFDGFPCDKETSPLAALLGLLDEETESQNYRRELWQNGARFPGWIKRPAAAPGWSPAAKTTFRDGWQKYAAGGVRAGGTPILEDDMEYHELSNGVTPEAAQQLEARKFSIAEVASAFYVPPVFVGVLDNANYSNVTAYREILYSDTLGPWFVEIQQGVNARLLPHPLVLGASSAFVEFNVDEKLRMSFDQRAKIFQTATGAPTMTRNEARRRMNLPALAGADELIVPLNVIEGGQASPTDSAPDGLPAAGGSSGASARSLSVAEVIQKVYLGVGKVITAAEARQIINDAGAELDISRSLSEE